MSTQIPSTRTALAVAVSCLFLAACMSAPVRPAGADAARSKLTQLQSDEQLASRAPVAIQEAEVAVRAAEVPQKDATRGEHLVQIADRKIDIAREQAQTRLSEDQRKTLSEQRESARLDSRTREADKARGDASSARADADSARSQAEALQKQIAELNARPTDRGLVVTLGDVLFATGRSELKGGATSNLARLATFLHEYPDRTVIIEGHTDNVGSDESNFRLSQQRADSVKAYLIGKGIESARLEASGKGEGSPVSGNDSASGRQQNRRVEIVISDTVTSLR